MAAQLDGADCTSHASNHLSHLSLGLDPDDRETAGRE